MMNLPQERLIIAAQAAAACEHVLELCLDYAKTREAFGKPIGKFQHNRFLIAEMATEATIARVFVDDCVKKHIDRRARRGRRVDGEVVDDRAAEARSSTSGVQLHGGYGYMMEYPIAQGLPGQPDLRRSTAARPRSRRRSSAACLGV